MVLMKKRWSIGILLAVMLFLSGCGADKTLYDELSKKQAESAAESGVIALQVYFSEDGTEGEYTAELTYSKTESGYTYCQKQFDPNGQVTFCEYSDGNATEQWMIGRGWEEIGESGFTEEKPHRYIVMCTVAPEYRLVQRIEKTEDSAGVCYTASLDPGKAKEAFYKESGCDVVKQEITVSFDPEGKLAGYREETVLHNTESGCDNVYRAELSFREHNNITKVERPALRTHYGAAK